MKWPDFSSYERRTRIQFILFLGGISAFLIYYLGIDYFTSILGTMVLIGGIIFVLNEIGSWFKK